MRHATHCPRGTHEAQSQSTSCNNQPHCSWAADIQGSVFTRPHRGYQISAALEMTYKMPTLHPWMRSHSTVYQVPQQAQLATSKPLQYNHHDTSVLRASVILSHQRPHPARSSLHSQSFVLAIFRGRMYLETGPYSPQNAPPLWNPDYDAGSRACDSVPSQKTCLKHRKSHTAPHITRASESIPTLVRSLRCLAGPTNPIADHTVYHTAGSPSVYRRHIGVIPATRPLVLLSS